MQTLSGHKAAIRSLAFDAQGRLVSGGEDGRVLQWRGAEAESCWEFGSYVTSLAACGPWLAIGLMDGRVELRREGLPMLALRNLRGCQAVAISQRWLAGGFQDGTVSLVELESLADRPGFRLKGHVTGLAFLQDGTLAACSPVEDGVQVWRLDQQEACGSLDLGRRRCLAALPAGGLAASGVCEVDSWPDGSAHLAPSPVRSLAAGGDWIAAGCLNGTICLWGPQPRLLQSHQAEVMSLAFHGDLLASGALDGSLRLWELEVTE